MKTHYTHTQLYNWLAVLCLSCAVLAGCNGSERSFGGDAEADDPVPLAEADLPTIKRQVREMLGADEHPQAPFRRWGEPVRYYVHGLEPDPHLLQQLEKQIDKVARLTGLEVRRHRRLRITEETAANGETTNAALFYTDDLKATLYTPAVKTILAGFETTPQAEYEKIMRYAKDVEDPAVTRRGYLSGNIKFFFQAGKLRLEKQVPSQDEASNIFLIDSILLLLDIYPANAVRSAYQKGSFEEGPKQLTSFDKLFFEAYYSDAIPKRATKKEAAKAIARRIAERARNEEVI